MLNNWNDFVFFSNAWGQSSIHWESLKFDQIKINSATETVPWSCPMREVGKIKLLGASRAILLLHIGVASCSFLYLPQFCFFWFPWWAGYWRLGRINYKHSKTSVFIEFQAPWMSEKVYFDLAFQHSIYFYKGHIPDDFPMRGVL